MNSNAPRANRQCVQPWNVLKHCPRALSDETQRAKAACPASPRGIRILNKPCTVQPERRVHQSLQSGDRGSWQDQGKRKAEATSDGRGHFRYPDCCPAGGRRNLPLAGLALGILGREAEADTNAGCRPGRTRSAQHERTDSRYTCLGCRRCSRSHHILLFQR